MLLCQRVLAKETDRPGVKKQLPTKRLGGRNMFRWALVS